MNTNMPYIKSCVLNKGRRHICACQPIWSLWKIYMIYTCIYMVEQLPSYGIKLLNLAQLNWFLFFFQSFHFLFGIYSLTSLKNAHYPAFLAWISFPCPVGLEAICLKALFYHLDYSDFSLLITNLMSHVNNHEWT